jgi:hypothetical protein
LTTLHLGVIDVPYVDPAPVKAPKARRGKANRPRKRRAKGSGAVTTGDVAEILEAKYAVMDTFVLLHEQEIADQFAEAISGALENLVVGAPPANNPFGPAEGWTEARFKRFLELQEMNGLVQGVPTRAALEGVRHRFKSKKNPAGPRPSFIDTGLYESSFKAWVET